MIIYYVFSTSGVTKTSVQVKVLNQIRAFNQCGVTCKGLFFTTDDFSLLPASTEFEFISVPKVNQGLFKSLKKRKITQQTICSFFECRNLDFDFIYYRYDNAGYFLSKLTAKYKKRMFFEHVTAETEEIKLYRKENPLRFNLSSFLGNIEYLWIPLLREKLWGKQIRRNSLLGVCNSPDIANYEKQMAGSQYQTFIGGDAVKTSDYTLRKKIPVLEKEFRIVFLKGASTAADFNGLDRIFKGIKNYQGAYTIRLFLYGKNLASEKQSIHQLEIDGQVVTGEYLQSEEIDTLMENMHLGVSAMGLHRKGINGTTTIKAREYFARGIPFIFGHHDPDISESCEAMKFCLEFKANDEAIDFVKVIEWYKNLVEEVFFNEKMRAFAENNLDYTIKMNKLKKYLEQAI
jgi:hypothetical protein